VAVPVVASCAIRLDTGMLAIAHGSGHVVVSYFAVAWGVAAAIVAFLSSLLGIVSYVVNVAGRRRINYRMSFCASLVRSVVPGLHVSYEGEELGDPHVLGIELAYRGRGDISGGSFEEGQPFRINVGVPLIGVIETDFTPAAKPLPGVEASGNEIRIGPGLVRSGQVLRLSVLADGAGGRLSHESPLADVRVRQRSADAKCAAEKVRLVIWWAIVTFIVFYLVSYPAGAVQVISHVLGGLRDAGNSLSLWVSSL
jgi:hypothetical protein